MKTLALSALTLCLCFVLIGCGDQQTEAPPIPASILNAKTKVEAKVEGMSCETCTGAICDAAKQIEGVEEAHADLKTETITLALKEDADAEAVMAAFKKDIGGLNEGQYTVKSVEAKTADQDPAKTCPADCEKECCKTP